MLQIFSPNFTDAKYNGKVVINLALTEDISTIINHAHLIETSSPILVDSSNATLNIECAFFILQMNTMLLELLITLGQSLLKLSLNFNGY
jgi:hypothetical protein